MANLDSTNKRRSATGIFHLYTIPFNPDGGDNAANREQATFIYSGISPGSYAPTVWAEAVFRGINAMTGEYVYLIGQIRT